MEKTPSMTADQPAPPPHSETAFVREAAKVLPAGREFLDKGVLPPILRRTVTVDMNSVER